MRKGILLGLVLALFVAIMPTAAQDEEVVPACTPEELEITATAINDLGAGYQEITAELGDGSDPLTLTAAVAGINALSLGFWNEVFPELPACAESIAISNNFGLALDESVISLGLTRLALYEAEFGDAEIAQGFVDYAAARAEWYGTIVQSTFGVMAETGEIPEAMLEVELPACTEEDGQQESVIQVSDSIAVYQELGTATADATPEELTQLIGGYAGLSATFWVEIYPNLPACAGVAKVSNTIGMIYDETLITLVLSRLALYEAENGDAEVATVLSEAATARQAMLQETAAEMFPPADE